MSASKAPWPREPPLAAGYNFNLIWSYRSSSCIPPKYAVSNVVGYIKGKSAITIARQFGGRERNFTGEVFWARGYFVSTVGLDEEMVRAYIRNQEKEDERYDQMRLKL